MRLRGRIERLEKKIRMLAKTHPCPRCGGDGRLAVLIGTDDPDPPGCERCGRLRLIRIIDVEQPSGSPPGHLHRADAHEVNGNRADDAMTVR